AREAEEHMNDDACPMAPLVEARHDGRLDERELASIQRHLTACAPCAALAAELDRIQALVRVPPLTPIDYQRGRLKLLRAAAQARVATKQRPIVPALGGLGMAVLIAVCAWVFVAKPREAPIRLARLPAVPRLAQARSETLVQPEAGTKLVRNMID